MTIFIYFWSARICQAVLPVSYRASKLKFSFEIELQQLPFFVNKYGIASNPSWGPKENLEGVWHCHFCQALADALRMNQTITFLNLVRSKIGHDDLKAWWWWNTGMWGASMGSNPRSFFSGSMWRPYPSITSYFKFGIQIFFSSRRNAFWKNNKFGLRLLRLSCSTCHFL